MVAGLTVWLKREEGTENEVERIEGGKGRGREGQEKPERER